MIENVLSFIKASPTPSLILNANAPDFTIAGANEAFLNLTNSKRHHIIGKRIFDAFPQKADDSSSKRRKILYNSLVHAFLVKKAHKITLLRYDLPAKHVGDGDTRFWNFDTYPILDDDGQVEFIVQNPVDVTQMVMPDKANITFDNKLLVDKNFQHPLFNEYPDAISTLDLKGNFVSANKVWVDLLECKLEELLKLSFVPFIAPENFDEVFRCFQKAIKGEMQQFDTRIITAKGNSRIIQITNLPIIINNEVIGIYIVAKDITLKIETEQELKSQREKLDNIHEALVASEQRFRSLIQEGSDLIAIVDADGTYKYVSPTSKAVLGIEADYFIGKIAFDFIYEDDKQRIIDEFARLTAERRIKISPFRFKINNRLIWVEAIITDMTDDPAVGGIVANSRDITQRVENELRLKENMERFDIVLKATSDTIWDWDLVTNKVIRSRGSNKRELFTNDWWISLVHPEDKERVLKKIQLYIKNKKSRWQDEYRFRDVNGNYKFIFDRGFLIYNKEGRAIRMLGAMQDVTERENYIKKIKDQNIKFREIAWIQSHVVRGPLCRIMGVANLLSNPDCDETTKRELLEYLNQSTAELDEIIRDIIKKAEILYEKG
ncbi:MAG: domain S-box-containing protein [Mucilaginibacter sp.]|nr:domain S-box-containing protein [Mucilaginibacter sp.]